MCATWPTTTIVAVLAKGNSPRALACLRNFAISMLRLNLVPNIKAALRRLAAQPDAVFAMLRL